MNWSTEKKAIRDAYEANGFVIVPRLYEQPLVDDIRANLQRYIDEIVPQLPPMDAFFEDAETRHQIRMLPRMEKHDSYFNDLLTTGLLPEIAHELCGEDVVAHDAAYFNKLPIVGDATPPHQDGFYFHLQPCKALTLWLALDHVDSENGCIKYVRGSHRRGMRKHARTQVVGFSQGIVDYGTDEDARNEVAAHVSPGDLIVHHAMTIHRTDANHSPRPRRAMGFVYFSGNAMIDQAASDQYQKQLASDWRAEGKI